MHGPSEWYRAQSARAGFQPDPGQRVAVAHLQRVFDELIEFKAYRQRPFMKTFGRRAPPRGLYLHGAVGRGKSMLMDAFYSQLPYRRKRRVHFHHFMQDVHHALAQRKGESDPLASVAAEIARKTRVLCLDEFHVADIGDAMILARLLRSMLDGGVVCVMTSNYPPDGLYPNGLQRERFLPAIALIKTKLDVIELALGPDYRLRALEKLELYHCPLGPEADEKLARAFASVGDAPGRAGALEINARKLHARKLAPGVAWFEFAELCGAPRSQADYLEIAREFHTVLLSNVPKMRAEHASEARRFTWLVDVFYDRRVNLIVSAEVPAHELYQSGANSHEFSRTVSRLQEMQSREYLAQQHGA